MKILMLTPYLPYPPASGGQIRTLNLLKYLSKNHEITLVSLYKSDREKRYSSYLLSFCHRVYACRRAEKPWQPGIIVRAVLTPKPLLIVRNFSIEARNLLEGLLEKEHFDIIHAETFYIMPHLPKTNIPIILVEQTIEYQVYQHFVNNLPLFMRAFLNFDVYKLKYWEKYYWQKASMVVAVSDLDQKMIQAVLPKLNPVVVPNGAGDEMFVQQIQKKELTKPIFLFQGNFFWLQNREAALYLIEKISPLIKKVLPNSEIIIAGQETKKIKKPQNTSIRLVEIKPEQTQQVIKLYQKATIFLAPIFGPGGTRLKILAAMASGLPIVSTQIGVEGLEVKNGVHVLIANTPQEFINKIKIILNDPNQYERVRNNAYRLAKEKYSWPAITQQLESVYKNIVNKI